jgi:ribosomal protein S18 acetylase RimI-like enzyme
LTVAVAEATAVDDDLVAAFARLVPQLSRSAPAPGRAELEAIVSSRCTSLLVARDCDAGGAVVGTLTLVVFAIPTGVRAWIEDVVTDAAAQGRGVATALLRRAVELAGDAGARTVDLTSRPDREAANRLYRRLGFTVRGTNVWRMTLQA